MSRSENIKIIKCVCVIALLFVFGGLIVHLVRQHGDFIVAQAKIRIYHSGEDYEAVATIIMETSENQEETEPDLSHLEIPDGAEFPDFGITNLWSKMGFTVEKPYLKLPELPEVEIPELPEVEMPEMPQVKFPSKKIDFGLLLDSILSPIKKWIIQPITNFFLYILEIDVWGPIRDVIHQSQYIIHGFLEGIRINLCKFLKGLHLLVDQFEYWINCNLSKTPPYFCGTTFLKSFLIGLENMEKKAEIMGSVNSYSQVAFVYYFIFKKIT